jgi:serine/threonine-protein kinase
MADRFEIVQPDAGEGGFGRVHRARDVELERDVAIKVLDPIFKLEPSAADRERFRREAKTLARLSHPNIPAIYDVIFDETLKDFRIIFEWIDGPTLAQHLKDRGVLGLDQASRVFGNICSALEHAHSKSIIHRDVKPSNIVMISNADACVLVDFGVSFNSDELTRLTSSHGIGTPGYMSPEQEKGGDLTPASDVYGLSILLYECLSGTRPAVGEYRSLESMNESIPPAIDALVEAGLRADPATRIPTPAEFLLRLTKALEPHANFMTTLTSGSLYEIQAALGAMSPSSFGRLPLGQRLAIMVRIKDLIRVNDPRLQNAVASLLSVLVRVSHGSRVGDFALVFEQALVFGFERQYSDVWTGSAPLRDALIRVAPVLEAEMHRAACATILPHLDSQDLGEKDRWYFHDLRVMLQNLLANPACADDDAEKLVSHLDDVNQMSHKVIGT